MNPDGPVNIFNRRLRAYALLCGSCLFAVALFSGPASKTSWLPGQFSPHHRLASIPWIMLWAWERPENLSFIDPRTMGVAFLAGTLYLRGGKVVAKPRLQPLQVPSGTVLTGVVRIESDRAKPPQLSADQQAEVASAIIKLTRFPRVVTIQVDFDAVVSERRFYRGLLSDLRRRLPETVGLSMTALASWCMSDDWLSDLPVDEAVPMLFRMGTDQQQVHSYLKAGKDFSLAVCQHSLGVATDEPLPQLPPRRRIYLFHPRSWQARAVQETIAELRQWH